MLTIHRIPLSQLAATCILPLTREGVIRIARSFSGQQVNAVRIVLTVDYEDEERVNAIEIALIELNAATDGNLSLQYVSHPLQSRGLTAAIAPCPSDFFAFIQSCKTSKFPYMLTPVCAEELEQEGLGPLASLNLRPENSAPVVPSAVDMIQMRAMMRAELVPHRPC